MADINVTLVLDDSQYTNKLKSAESTASAFGTTVTAGFTNIKSSMDRISEITETVNKRFYGRSQEKTLDEPPAHAPGFARCIAGRGRACRWQPGRAR